MTNYIKNSPYYILGEHKNCDKYFCNGSKSQDQNLVPIAENCGLMKQINMATVVYSITPSFLKNVDNNIYKQFNSMINKFIGGKRTNLF